MIEDLSRFRKLCQELIEGGWSVKKISGTSKVNNITLFGIIKGRGVNIRASTRGHIQDFLKKNKEHPFLSLSPKSPDPTPYGNPVSDVNPQPSPQPILYGWICPRCGKTWNPIIPYCSCVPHPSIKLPNTEIIHG